MNLTATQLAEKTGLSIATTARLVKRQYNGKIHTRTQTILENLVKAPYKLPSPNREVLVFNKLGKFLGSTPLQTIEGTNTKMIKIDG